MRTVADLHCRVIHVATLCIDNKKIQTLCVTLLRSPLPASPAPGDDIDTLEKIDSWLSATTAQAAEDIATRFLGSVDALFDLLIGL